MDVQLGTVLRVTVCGLSFRIRLCLQCPVQGLPGGGLCRCLMSEYMSTGIERALADQGLIRAVPGRHTSYDLGGGGVGGAGEESMPL